MAGHTGVCVGWMSNILMPFLFHNLFVLPLAGASYPPLSYFASFLLVEPTSLKQIELALSAEEVS